MGDLVTVFVIVVLVLIAAFLSMAEAAITRTNRVKAHHLADQKRRGAQFLLRIVEDPAPYLNVILLTTLACHVTGTALATTLALRNVGSGGEAVAAAAMTFVLFVFAEVVPKTLTVQRTERSALLIARSVYLLGRSLKPIGRALLGVANATMALLPGKGLPKGPFVTEEEIRHLVDVAEEEEEIEEEERELIHSVFEFGDTLVREVMVPRTDMVTIHSNATLDEALEAIIRGGYSRIPIYEGHTDNIVGVLYAKDALKRIHESEGAVKVSTLGR
ncbi:MAG: CNNM domain-containing protein, partial [Actinomycetota bacterium]